jgi:hypothetical protein
MVGGGWWVVGANMKYENTNQLLKERKKERKKGN